MKIKGVIKNLKIRAIKRCKGIFVDSKVYKICQVQKFNELWVLLL